MNLLFNEFLRQPQRSILAFLFSALLLSSCQIATDNKPPEENRFTTSILSNPGTLNEPMAFTFLDNEEILIVERKGGVKSFNVETREIQSVATIAVNTFYVNKEGQPRPAEEGLMGVVGHPEYAINNWVFMLYADPDEPKHVLARWEYKDGNLNEDSKKIVLEYPVQREVCCHTGGGMVFDKAGNLFLTTGNNTANPPQGTSNLDERPGNKNSDDQRTSANSNDLRGKIVRIHPEDDGSYTIPAGNLFPKGTSKTRPEIYTMGHRNAWRVSIDNETGYIYWGEVGPDASEDSDQGPRGYDEFNQAKEPGFFGWPYFTGDNMPYADYDYETDSIYGQFDVNNPINTSPNNTGVTNLPPPQEAFLWYPYGHSEEFPLMGSAGRSATGGPVFRQSDFPESDKRFPPYYEGKWLIAEFMRGWIMAVTMDELGDYISMEPFLPKENFSSAIDMQFSPDGDLYVLEYGSAWFRGNDNAQIKRIQFNGGNRTPIVQARADKVSGEIPLVLQLSSEGTIDYDKDYLTYDWTVKSSNGFLENLNGAQPAISLSEAGVYTIELVVTDSYGNSNEQQFEVIAGNESPEVDIQITEGNQTFFFPDSRITYKITVTDKEDGTIKKEEIAVNFDYAPEGFDPIEIAQNHRSTDDWVTFSKGKSLIDESDCFSCHRVEEKSIGPSYQDVARTYELDKEEQALMADRIISGSVGTWGEHAMSAHPDLSSQDAELMVDYIMSLNDPQPENVELPLSGDYVMKVPEKENGKGGYLLRVAYTDKGNNNLKSLTSEKIVALRNPIIDSENYDASEGTQLLTTPFRSFNVKKDGAWLVYRQLDLTGIGSIGINAEASPRTGSAGGVIELHLGDRKGLLVGSTEKVVPIEINFQVEYQKLISAWEKGGKKGHRPGFGAVRDLFQKIYSIDVSHLKGVHSICLVFKNTDASKGQILMQMNTIEFIQEEQI